MTLSSFGSTLGPVCGKVKESSGEVVSQEETKSSLTNLLQKMWGNGVGNGNATGNSDGKSVCTQQTQAKGLLSQSAGSEYLGLCGTSKEKTEVKDLSFLEVKKNGQGVDEVSLCVKSCGMEGERSEIQNLSNKNNSNGHKIEFYNMKSKTN